MFSKTIKSIIAMTILTMFINFTLSGSVKVYAASWKSVKDAGFSTSAAYYTSIATAADRTPYVAYKDVDNGGRVTVKKYNGNDWITVGDKSVSASTASYISIATSGDGIPYVVYMDGENNNKITVKKYDGNSWTIVGEAGFSTSTAYYTSIAIDKDGIPYVIYKDAGNDSKATVKKYDGNRWTTVGSEGFSEGIVNYTSIEVDRNGVLYAAYMDGGNGNRATVMKYSAPTEVYKVELSQEGTYIFEERTEGYSSTTPASVTITKAGSGHITNLNAVLNGENAGDFELGALSATALDDNTTEAKFTIQPKDNLTAGIYEATVIITLNEIVSKSFDVSFTVIPKVSNDIKLPVPGEIIVEDEILESEKEQEENKVEITTPAAVRIEGTERVGNILEARLLDENGTKINTYSGITYKWYRLSSKESEDAELVWEDESYKLVDSDEDKYIKLEAYYDGYMFKGIVTKMIRKSLGGINSSLKNN